MILVIALLFASFGLMYGMTTFGVTFLLILPLPIIGGLLLYPLGAKVLDNWFEGEKEDA